MSGNGGRRQVRQRTSKDAAYAKRLQDTAGGAGVCGRSSSAARASSNRRADTASEKNEPMARSASASSGGGRKRQRTAATANGAPSPTNTSAAAAAAGSADSPAATDDGTKRQKRRGPGPEWACSRCTLHNSSRKRKCEACGTAKPTATAGAGAGAGAGTGTDTSTASLAPSAATSSENASIDGGGKKRARASSNDEDNADGDGNPRADAPAAASAADKTELTPSSSSSASRNDGKGKPKGSNSVSEWLRKVKQKKQQGSKSSSKGGKGSSSRSKSKSGRGRSTGDSSSRSRSRSRSPVPASAAAAAADITENKYFEGLNRKDLKLVQVRIFDRCDGHGRDSASGGGPSQRRRELSDSGPLVAEIMVGQPRFCPTREETPEKKDGAKESPSTGASENENIAPTGATLGANGTSDPNEGLKAAANFASSSVRAPGDMVVEQDDEKDDLSVGDSNDEAPHASGSQVEEGNVAAERMRLSPAIGTSRCERENVDSDLSSPRTGSGALGNETIEGNMGIIEPASTKNGEVSNVDITPKELPANSTPAMNKESLPATIQNDSSTATGCSAENTIAAASADVPSQSEADEVQATGGAGPRKMDAAKTKEDEHDQYQQFSYDLQITDQVEAGTNEVQAFSSESGAVLSGRPTKEESVESDEPNGEEIAASDDKAVDPGTTTPIAETSRLEATYSSSSEIIAKSIGTEAQSETQPDFSAPNEDESRQEARMSQESNGNYDAFQPLTQAVPMFEYGYDLTQQQEEEFKQEPALSYPEEQVDVDTTNPIADDGTTSDPGGEADNACMLAAEKEQHVGSMAFAEAQLVPKIVEKPSAESERVSPQQPFESLPEAAEISTVPLFSTGGGASISISAEAMARANKMFEDPSSNGDANTTSIPASNQGSESRAVAPGAASLFSTTGGSSISISVEAMKRAENIFSHQVKEHQMKEPKELAVEGGLGLFSTAGGSSISVSKDSMEKVAHLFDVQTTDCLDTTKKPDPPSNAPTASAGLALFSTAGGRKIQVSDEALASADALFAKEGQSKSTLRSSPLVPSPASKDKAAIETPSTAITDNGLGLATQSPSIAKTSGPIFSTAGKKREIAVNPQAVARANELLGKDQNQGQPVPSFAMPALFSTAGKGLAIEVSEEGLTKASQIFEGSSCDDAVEEARAPSQMAPSSSAAALFSSAGGSSISVTADAVAKAGEIFNDTAQQKALVAPSNASSAVPSVAVPPSTAALFSTAGGSSIAVSDDAISRAGQLLGDTGQNQGSMPLPPAPPPAASALRTPAPSAAALFSTAGGASISVSDDAMAKANQMFTESDMGQPSALSGQVAQREPAFPLEMGLFSTAGGSSIAVSADAMSKANQIFAKPTNEAPSSTVATSSARLFSTAAGSSIAVSDDAMTKANQILDEAPKAPPSSSLSSAPKASMGASSLFATAGGASINVSDDALAKANQMFRAETNNEPNTDNPTPPSSATMQPPMFSTAGNNQAISVSDQGLAKANEMFGGTQQEGVQAPAMPVAAMFTTAGQGTSIAVSDDALVKANEILAQNSSSNPSSGSQGEAQNTRSSARPRIHFAETPAQPAMRRRTNRSSLGGTAAKNVNIAQHMHPAETPLPAIARGGSAQPLSTKKVLFREDNYQDRTQRYGGRESSGAPANISTTGPNIANAATAATTAATAFTPKHTPQVARKPAAVTRSTIVRNPYAKRPGVGPADTSSKSSHSSAVTPVPFAFKHVEGTFSGKKFSPKTLERAARILEDQPSSHSLRHSSASGKSVYGASTASASTTSRRPRHLDMDGRSRVQMKLDGSDFHFSIDGNRLSLQEFDDIYGPMEDANHQTCLDGGANPLLLKINSANASKLRFDEQTGLPCAMFGASNASGCKMVGNVQDLRRDLISRGCDEALLVDKWIVNHFGWINWKLACTERRYPHALAGKYFTYDHVLSQLKGRYDREIASAKRPALRIILNRDASAGRLMILCVAQIHRFRIKVGSGDSKNSEESNSPPPSSSKLFREELRLELTDGWYSVQAVLDSHLQAFVEQGKIKVGTKLLVAGAELAGSEDGVDPLDASYQPSRSSCPVALKLVANATRRAKWDAKLGFIQPTRQIQSQDGMLLVKSMGDVIPGGGSVPLMDLIICRRFPRSFLEKGPDGTSTILTEAQEERRRREFDERRHREMEKISEAAEKECTREVDEQAPEQWRKMVASSAMCDYYERLSRDDKAVVDRWEERRSSMINDMTRRMIDAKMQSNVSLFRSSTPFLRITVKSLQNPPPPTSATDDDEDIERIIPNQPSATLTVWRMTEDQTSILREGTVVRMKDLTVKSELRDETLQFSANDKTRMQALAQQPSSRQLQYSGFSRRSFAPIIRAHVLSRKASSSRKASGAHMDFAGVLVRSEHEQHGMMHTSYSYFTDESGLLLRLQRDLDPNDESALVGWNKVLELGQVLAFKDVLVLPFDSKANCAVVSWSQPTLQEKKVHLNDRRIKTLQKWTESEDAERTCETVLASFDAGLPLYCRLPQRTEIAMGYILAIRPRDAGIAGNEYGGQYRSVSNEHSFEIDIDCGGGSNLITATCSRAVLSQTIEMHIDPASRSGAALDLRDLLRQSGSNASENLAPCDLTNLNLLFTESGILFQVMLRKQTTSLEILQISPANVSALAALYLEALK